MFLLLPYLTVGNSRQSRSANRPASVQAPVLDYVTPDGTIVPRAIGQAAIDKKTAFLISGFLVGYWSKTE